VDHKGISEEGGRALLRFSDPEGQALALVDDGGAPGGTPWERSPVPVEHGIRGIHAVRLLVQNLERTAWVLTEVMGFRQTGEYAVSIPSESSRGIETLAGNGSGRRTAVFETGPGGPGAEVQVESGSGLLPRRSGKGGVHHVAFRTPDDHEHQAWRQRIAEAGLGVTPVIDRYYFKSIYFREPGGILFEIATDGPGFAADEDSEHLGERLALPPFLEPRRRQIEAQLHPLEIEEAL
jgi:glyoxalase family protein